jgi:hypothetical protein
MRSSNSSSGTNQWLILTLAAVVLISLIRALSIWSVGQLLRSAWPASVVSFVFISSLMLSSFDQATARISTANAFGRLLSIVVISLLISIAVAIAWSALLLAAFDIATWPTKALKLLEENKRAEWITLRVPAWVFLSIAASLGLFWWRRRWRTTYGATEAVVGVLVVFNKAAFPSSNEITSLAILTAGVYLMVRGLDNVHQGMKDCKDRKPCDFLARILVKERENPSTSVSNKLITRLFYE